MKSSSVTKNFIMNVILKISGFIFPLLTFPYASRVLGPNGIGKVAFSTSVIAYFLLVSQLGIPTYGVREAAIVRDDKRKLSTTTAEILLINIVMSCAVYITLFISLVSVPKFADYRELLIISSTQILFSTIGVEWLYQALEKYTYITIRSILFKAISIILLFLFVKKESDYIQYALITVFAGSASNILNFIQLRKEVNFRTLDKINIRRHLAPVFVFFAMTCATTVYNNIDSTMLGFMTSDADVGYYNAAIKIKVILIHAVTALGTVLLPRLSNYVDNDRREFWRLIKKSACFSVFVSLPLMVYFAIFAKESIVFLSGVKYVEAVEPMQILMGTLPVIGISHVLGMQLLLPLKKEKKVLYAAIIGAVIDIIINAALIPSMKSSGAAIGTVVAEFAVLICEGIAIKKQVKEVFAEVEWIKFILSISISAGISLVLRRICFTNTVLLIVSCTVFFSTYYLLLLVLKENFALVLKEKLCVFIRRRAIK